jgi:Flp pilus assembly pilin Flp
MMGRRIWRRARQLRQDERGATIVEFALVAPVLLLSIMGICDIGYNIYTQALLRGAIQKAARDSTIEGAGLNMDLIDVRVTRAVRNIVPSSDLRFDRSSYTSFTDVSQPEDYNDLDGDGQCNNGEPFEDANANGTWDSDRGATGLGGARDVVLYNVTVQYARAFPLAGMIGLPDTVSTNATTVLRNQPYGTQEDRAIPGNCA